MSNIESELKDFKCDRKSLSLFKSIKKLILTLITQKKASHQRFLSIPDYFIDRWERAQLMGFESGTSVYDSCLVLGEVHVGKNTWIGPYTILDGSGGSLNIGDNCAISAGVHIYTHDSVDHVINGTPISTAPVVIGNNVYIGPQTIIAKGVTIGDYVVIGANSFVNKDIPAGSKAYGNPVKVVGCSRQEQ